MLLTVHCSLPTAYCLLPTAYCLLPTAFSPSVLTMMFVIVKWGVMVVKAVLVHLLVQPVVGGLQGGP